MLRSNKATALEILVVDDDKVVALMHKNQLRCSNIQPAPVVCTNGLEALDYLQKNDCVDKHFLVLLDLNMPLVNGWKFLNKLKKGPPLASIYVVIVTSSINQKDYIKAHTYEQVILYCQKPLSPSCISNIKSTEALQPFFTAEIKKAEER